MTAVYGAPPRADLPDPWLRFRTDWPDVDLAIVDLGNQWEITRWSRSSTIVMLNERLTQVQRRAAIAHACEHLDRGAPCGTLRATIEARVVAATARYLLPDLDLVAETLAMYDARRAAHELWVPWGILVDRLRGLTDRELDFIAERRARSNLWEGS